MSKLALDLCQRQVIVPTARWPSKRKVRGAVPIMMRKAQEPSKRKVRGGKVLLPFPIMMRKAQEQFIKAMRIETPMRLI